MRCGLAAGMRLGQIGRVRSERQAASSQAGVGGIPTAPGAGGGGGESVDECMKRANGLVERLPFVQAEHMVAGLIVPAEEQVIEVHEWDTPLRGRQREFAVKASPAAPAEGKPLRAGNVRQPVVDR